MDKPRAFRSGAAPFRSIFLATILLAGWLALTASVWGQDAPRDIDSQEPPTGEAVVVVGSRARYYCPEGSGKTCPVLDVSDSFRPPDTDMSEILEGEPGVMVLELGGPEGPWYVSMRGMDPANTAVYLDGVLLNDPLGTPVDMSGFSPLLVDHILVYRGYAPAGYPVAGTAGVIDIRSAPPRSEEAYRGQAWVDSISTWDGSYWVTGGAAGGAGLVGVSHQAGSGRYDYIDRRGTYTTESDDRHEVRSHNSFSDHELTGRFERKADGYRAYGGAYYTYRRRELPGAGHDDAERATGGSETVIAHAGFDRPGVLTPNLDAEIKLHYIHRLTWFYDEYGETGLPRQERGIWDRYGANLDLDFFGLRNNAITATVAYHYDQYAPQSLIDPKTDDLAYRRTSVFVNIADEITLFDGRLRVRPRARFGQEHNQYEGQTLVLPGEETSDRSSHYYTGFDISAWWLVYESLWLVTTAGNHTRAPAFLEEFGDRSIHFANASLSPQRAVALQGGLLYHPGQFAMVDDLRVELMMFHLEVSDPIVWERTSADRLHAENGGDSSWNGFEVKASVNMEDILIAEMTYTWQEPNRAPGGLSVYGYPTPEPAANTAHLSAVLRRSYGQLYYDFYYQDIRALEEDGGISAEYRGVHDLGAVYYQGRWSVGFEVRNLGNDRGPEILDYPLPGRRYVIFMEVKG